MELYCKMARMVTTQFENQVRFWRPSHYSDVIMGTMASQITSLTIVDSTVYSGADQRKHQSSASLAFVRGIHRGPVNSLHKWPVTRKLFPFDDVIMFMTGILVLVRRHLHLLERFFWLYAKSTLTIFCCKEYERANKKIVAWILFINTSQNLCYSLFSYI